MKIIEARELLKIDFDKYTSISINGVLFSGIKLEIGETETHINIIGRINEKPILATTLSIKDQTEISEEKGTIYIERIRR